MMNRTYYNRRNNISWGKEEDTQRTFKNFQILGIRKAIS